MLSMSNFNNLMNYFIYENFELYVYMYMHTYIQMHICMHAYLNICTHTYTCKYIFNNLILFHN